MTCVLRTVSSKCILLLWVWCLTLRMHVLAKLCDRGHRTTNMVIHCSVMLQMMAISDMHCSLHPAAFFIGTRAQYNVRDCRAQRG